MKKYPSSRFTLIVSIAYRSLRILDLEFKNIIKILLMFYPINSFSLLLDMLFYSGDVLVFLDSHCESQKGWLEPLLARLKEKPKIAVTPDIETISWQNFNYLKKSQVRQGLIEGFLKNSVSYGQWLSMKDT